MKKIIYIGALLLSLGLTGSFFTACGDDKSDGGFEGLVTAPDEKFNAKICVISSLKDGATVNTSEQAKAISQYINTKASDAFIVMVDRADAVYSTQNMNNPIVKTADETDRFSAVAFNRFNGNTIEASYLLVDEYYFYGVKEDEGNGKHASRTETSLKLADDCYLKTIESVMFKGTNSELAEGEQNIEFHRELSTLRINSSNHVKAYVTDALGKIKVDRPILFHFGTIKSSLISELKNAVSTLDDSYQVSIAEGTESAEYSIFLVAHKNFWAIKKTTKENVTSGIDAYTLNLMW